LIRTLGRGRRVALVGASLGGMISLMAATDTTLNIGGVILVDVVPQVETEGARRIRAFMEKHSSGFATLSEAAAAIADYRGQPPTADLSGLSKNLRLRPDGRYYWHWDPTFLARMPSAGLRTNMLEEAARRYRGPLLLLHGQQSDIVGNTGVAALRALAPQLEYIQVAKASHMVVNDRNDAFNEAIHRFLLQHFGSQLPQQPAR
jgi:pimeloyl-ACP methyl ester carboxylesterase